MTQSVELTLDPTADAAIAEQWRRLAEAGLPSSQRREPSPHHRPHVTLFAADTLRDGAELELRELMVGLDLTLRIGGVLLFGPHRSRYVLGRQVVTTAELLDLQGRVHRVCDAGSGEMFAPGRWTPHVTLAPRVTAAQVGPALEVLGAGDEVVARITDCRRWDSERRTAWGLTD